MIMTLVSLDTSFVASRWQTTLLFLAMQLLCTAIPCFFARALPKLEEMFFWASVVAPFVGFVTLLATSHGNKQDAKTVFVDYENNTGWPHGLTFLISIGQTMYIYIGTDGATRIAGSPRARPKHPAGAVPDGTDRLRYDDSLWAGGSVFDE